MNLQLQKMSKQHFFGTFLLFVQSIQQKRFPCLRFLLRPFPRKKRASGRKPSLIHQRIFLMAGKFCRSRSSCLRSPPAGRQSHPDRCGSPLSAPAHFVFQTVLSPPPERLCHFGKAGAAGLLHAGDGAPPQDHNAPGCLQSPLRYSLYPHGCAGQKSRCHFGEAL